jgi:hypothetical protein
MEIRSVDGGLSGEVLERMGMKLSVYLWACVGSFGDGVQVVTISCMHTTI